MGDLAITALWTIVGIAIVGYFAFCIGQMQVLGLRLVFLWFERGFMGALLLQVQWMLQTLRRGWPFLVLAGLVVAYTGGEPLRGPSIPFFTLLVAIIGLATASVVGLRAALVAEGVMTDRLGQSAARWGYIAAVLVILIVGGVFLMLTFAP